MVATEMQQPVVALDPDFDSTEQLEVPSGFEVRDAESANWVVKKILEARQYAEKCREWADREEKRAQRDEQWFLQRFGPGLASFASENLKGKKRSVSLPAGSCGWRKQPARLVVLDEPMAMEWARKNAPAAVVAVPATERLSKSALAEAVKATGEIPAGTTLNPEHDAFYVK